MDNAHLPTNAPSCYNSDMSEEQPIDFDQIEIPIIYRDKDMIVVHKPSGIVVHPDDRNRLERISLMVLVRRICRHRVYPIHRLDRPTSGVIVYALNRPAASALSKQFREHTVKKEYLALVRGIPEDQLIDYALKELLRHEDQSQILELRGSIEWEGSLSQMRKTRLA